MLAGLNVTARVALAGAVVWRNFVFPFCSRTPVAELAGNPLLRELFVPSVFQIRCVAILDRAVPLFLREQALEVPVEFHDEGRVTPGGRIRYLVHRGVITNPDALRTARRRRNELAHEDAGEIGWAEFDQDAQAVEAALDRMAMRESVETVREFRRTSEALRNPVHRKHYLGALGMITAAAAELYTTHLALKAATRPPGLGRRR